MTPKLWTPRFIGVLVMNVFTFTIMYMQIATLPNYVLSIGGSRIWAGFSTGFYTGAALLLRPVVGYSLDRFGRKLNLVTGLFLVLLSLVLYFFLSQSLVPFFLVRILSGAAFCFLSTTAGALISDLVPDSRLGEGIGYFAFSTILGTALGPILSLNLYNRGGYTAFLDGALATGFAALIAGIFLFGKIPRREIPSSATREKSRAERIAPARFAPSLCLLLIAVSLGFILSFIQTMGKERNIVNISHFFTFYSVSVLLIRMFGSKAMDSLGVTKLAYSSLALMIACFGILAIGESYVSAVISACLFGVGFGILQPLMNFLQVKIVPESRRGLANAAYFAAMDLGVTLGSIGLGFVLTGSGFTAIFLGLAGLMLVVGWIFRSLIKPVVLVSVHSIR